jgi:hypothetical protein
VFSADAKLRSDSLLRERGSVAAGAQSLAMKQPATTPTCTSFGRRMRSRQRGRMQTEKSNTSAARPRPLVRGQQADRASGVPVSSQNASAPRVRRRRQSGRHLGTWKYEPGNIEWFKDGKIRMTTSQRKLGPGKSIRHETDSAILADGGK